MLILLETFGYVALCIIVGLVLFAIYASISAGNAREDKYQNLSGIYGTRQVHRAREKASVLMRIGAPACDDGTYAPWQNDLWRQYRELDAVDKEQTEIERNALVDAR